MVVSDDRARMRGGQYPGNRACASEGLRQEMPALLGFFFDARWRSQEEGSLSHCFHRRLIAGMVQGAGGSSGGLESVLGTSAQACAFCFVLPFPLAVALSEEQKIAARAEVDADLVFIFEDLKTDEDLYLKLVHFGCKSVDLLTDIAPDEADFRAFYKEDTGITSRISVSALFAPWHVDST